MPKGCDEALPKAVVGSDKQTDAMVALGNVFSSVERDWARFARCFGLSATELNLLYFIDECEGAATQSDACAQLGLSKQVVNLAVKTLLKKDLVKLEEAPTDRRRKIMAFTEAGKALSQRIVKACDAADRACVEALSPEEMSQLMRFANLYASTFAKAVDQLEDELKRG